MPPPSLPPFRPSQEERKKAKRETGGGVPRADRAARSRAKRQEQEREKIEEKKKSKKKNPKK
jgi:hypothetical protein